MGCVPGFWNVEGNLSGPDGLNIVLIDKFGRIGMTRPDWQKKRKKMSGREGPKKGKNR
jgi:hypothetical protein